MFHWITTVVKSYIPFASMIPSTASASIAYINRREKQNSDRAAAEQQKLEKTVADAVEEQMKPAKEYLDAQFDKFAQQQRTFIQQQIAPFVPLLIDRSAQARSAVPSNPSLDGLFRTGLLVVLGSSAFGTSFALVMHFLR